MYSYSSYYNGIIFKLTHAHVKQGGRYTLEVLDDRHCSEVSVLVIADLMRMV